MGRSAPIWAVRAQLLAKLRPFAESGQASEDLIPELAHHARGLSAAELRLALAAYSQRRSADLEQLQELLVRLLVGGSRLGTPQQLLDAAEALAHFAPCRCRPAAEFWGPFADRVNRLMASASLDAMLMGRVLAACAQWKQRCATEVNWGHMLRTVGGRLAEELHSLQVEEVVSLARHAAKLGEPQVRLAAAIGHRVGHLKDSQLSAQDLIDLIGAAGRLGGRLHMMTRALADQLEPRVEALNDKALVQVTSHLGALNMFPHRLAAALEVALAQRLVTEKFALQDRLKLLHALGRLRWRSKQLLSPILESLPLEADLEQLGVEALAGIIYELYRLDVWDEAVAEAVLARLRALLGGQRLVQVPCKVAANLLLALSYFSLPEKELHQRLVQELLREKELPQEALYQLKAFEMAVRLGHAAVSLGDLGGLAARWLFSLRGASGAPEARGESNFAEEVAMVARNISWHHEAEVEVGPYLLDFAAVSQEPEKDMEAWDEDKPGRSLARFCVAVEADGPSHFYRPQSLRQWTSSSKLRHRLLSTMRIRVAHVPYYEWLQLEGLAQKEAYLMELLLRAHSTEFASLSIDSAQKGGRASTREPPGRKASFVERRVARRASAAT